MAKSRVYDAQAFVQQTVPQGSNVQDVVANLMNQNIISKKEATKYIKDFKKKYSYGTQKASSGDKIQLSAESKQSKLETFALQVNADKNLANNWGRSFIWLSSSSKKPRQSHMLRYGKVFTVGTTALPTDDNFPGMAWNCKCSFEWIDAPETPYNKSYEATVNLKRSNAKLPKFTKDNNIQTTDLLKTIKSGDITKIQETGEQLLRKLYKTAPRALEAFADYTQPSKFKAIQSILRTEQPISSTTAINRSSLIVANARNYLPSPTNLQLTRIAQISESLKVGDIITSGRMPKSLSMMTQKTSDTLFHITLLPQSRIMPIAPISAFPHELEVLLAPGSLLKVVKMSNNEVWLRSTGLRPGIKIKSIAW